MYVSYVHLSRATVGGCGQENTPQIRNDKKIGGRWIACAMIIATDRQAGRQAAKQACILQLLFVGYPSGSMYDLGPFVWHEIICMLSTTVSVCCLILTASSIEINKQQDNQIKAQNRYSPIREIHCKGRNSTFFLRWV